MVIEIINAGLSVDNNLIPIKAHVANGQVGIATEWHGRILLQYISYRKA